MFISFKRHRCRRRQILGDATEFCPNFPKLARNVYVRFILPTKERPFFGVTSKIRSSSVFLQMLAPFLRSNKVGRHFVSDFQEFCPNFQFRAGFRGFCPDFQGFCPDFQQIQTFWGELAPASCTTAREN